MSEEPYSRPAAPPPMPPAGGQRLGDQAGMRLLLPVGNSGWAIASGYLGLVSVLILPAPFAMVTGILALREIKRSKQTGRRKHGTGRAIFGLVMGGLCSLIGLLLLGQALIKS
ncbi:DUF4190 domain-containing protein [Haloferula rosea]|uniref:DUF4190 domain-containing protein n=1 Tax=Haloferula rosea TaxID=490093 RepID=A0A934RDR4_9BACT|nr:DUF4190 domain-containing protein [Haloferula rosea]MBK1828878.1 DUF4190 domain-containing protein [Haloferula rosea]